MAQLVTSEKQLIVVFHDGSRLSNEFEKGDSPDNERFAARPVSASDSAYRLRRHMAFCVGIHSLTADAERPYLTIRTLANSEEFVLKFNIIFYPWHSWIARQTPTLKAVGSNPIG